MELREARPDDVETLVDLWYSLATEMEEYSDLNELVYDGPEEVPGDGFRDHLASDDVTDYLLHVDGATVGFLTLRWGRHPSRTSSTYAQLVNLYVRDPFRDRGYGASAVERVKTLATERGCDHLKVTCEWDNVDARRFYDDCGFEEKRVEFVQRLA